MFANGTAWRTQKLGPGITGYSLVVRRWLEGRGKGEKRRACPGLPVPAFGGLVRLTYNVSKGFCLLLIEDPLLGRLLEVSLWMQGVLTSVLWLTVLKKQEEIKLWNK